MSVETAIVQEQEFPRGISAGGSLLSNESVVLRPEMSGRIQSIDLKLQQAAVSLAQAKLEKMTIRPPPFGGVAGLRSISVRIRA